MYIPTARTDINGMIDEYLMIDVTPGELFRHRHRKTILNITDTVR